MAKIIPQRELRNQNAAVIAAVATGETFVVTRNGVPVAELRPLPQERHRFVARTVLREAVVRSPHIDAVAFRSDIDKFVEQALS